MTTLAPLTELQTLLKTTVEARHKDTVFDPLGIRVEQYHPDETIVAIDVDTRHYQHAGIVHGGVWVVLAESAASIAAALSVDMTKNIVSGMEINANHLRPVTTGTVRATARPVHRGKSTMVYQITLEDEDGRTVCISRCTLAVRPMG